MWQSYDLVTVCGVQPKHWDIKVLKPPTSVLDIGGQVLSDSFGDNLNNGPYGTLRTSGPIY